jgi:phospholipid-binding lipoprotein MlaA
VLPWAVLAVGLSVPALADVRGLAGSDLALAAAAPSALPAGDRDIAAGTGGPQSTGGEERSMLAPNGRAPADADTPGGIRDPFEGWNRGVYGFNKGLDRAIVRPAAMGYRRALPREAREGVHNVLANLGAPVIFFNDVLQVQPHPAGETAVRFAVNTTVGLLGVFDVASQMGIYRHRADFGQTLGRYGVGAGPYVYLPVFGPSSVRDTVGLLVNTAMDPLNYARYDGDTAVKLTVIGTNALDTRVRLDRDLMELERSATDPYAATRSVWIQNRRAFIRGDQPEDVQALPDFTPDAPAAPAGTSPVPNPPSPNPPAGH